MYRGVSYNADVDLRTTDSQHTVRLLRANNVQGGAIVFDDIQIVIKERVKEIQVLQKGDILVCMANGSRALVGKAAQFAGTETPYTFGAFMGCFRSYDAEDANYISYLLQSSKYRRFITILLAGSSINNLRPADIENMEFFFPTKDKREKIIASLRAIDNQIFTTQKLLTKYESIKKATVNLLLKPKEGWQATQIGDVCQEIHDRVPCSDLTLSTYISTENLLPERQGIVKASGVPYGVNVIGFQENDILISNIRPYLKKIWFAEFSGGCSNDVIVYRAKENVHPRLLFHMVSQDAFFNFAMDNATGTKMPRGDRKLLPLFPIALPPSLAEQEQIANGIDKWTALLEHTRNVINKLETQKQSMLQYFFG